MRPPTISRTPTLAAFVGACAAGPKDTPVKVTSQAGFQRRFGRAPSDLAQAAAQFFANGGSTAWIVNAADLPGSKTAGTGLYALDGVPGFNVLALPGVVDPTIQSAALDYAQTHRAFMILDLPATVIDLASANAWLSGAAANLRRPNAAAYLPRLASAGSGAIAGLYARTDAAKGVWTAPAGAQATLAGVTGLPTPLPPAEAEQIGRTGLNVLRALPTGGVVAWGARTLAGADGQDPEWRYVPVRRLALFIERSLDPGLRWAVSQPNGPPLWALLRQACETFLIGLFRDGAFRGARPSDAFFVRCGPDTMTPADIAAGNLNVEIGIAPVRPAEFVILRIGQWADPNDPNHHP
jgi:phage tail sheath protein FI